MERELMTDSNDDFLNISEEELSYMRDVRLEIETKYNKSVVTELIDVTPTEIVLRVMVEALDLDDALTINRQKLTWTI